MRDRTRVHPFGAARTDHMTEAGSAEGFSPTPKCVRLLGMGFFESMPEVPPVGTVRPEGGPWMPWMRPAGVLPGTVGADVVLVRTDEVAVVVSGMRAFENGFELAVHEQRRDEPANGRWMSRGPRTLPRRIEKSIDPAELLRQMLKFGVRYADGRRGATPRLPAPLQREAPPPGEVLIASLHSGGSRQDTVHRYWLHPLPPEGPLTFVASWPGWGVPETSAEIDSTLISEASRRAVRLWPDAG
jgi:hypothetical protein